MAGAVVTSHKTSTFWRKQESGERRKAFSDLVRNGEGEYREYYQSLSRNFKDLKESAKDALREYYLAADRRRVASLSASARKRCTFHRDLPLPRQ
jgi:hypothetical protein